MTIVEETRAITGGAGTHSGVHVAAALDPLGGLLGTREFPATSAGYAGLLGWLGKFGHVALVGVEGTGSYGAGLARYLAERQQPDQWGFRLSAGPRRRAWGQHRNGRSRIRTTGRPRCSSALDHRGLGVRPLNLAQEVLLSRAR
jgi:hypothetical protein